MRYNHAPTFVAGQGHPLNDVPSVFSARLPLPVPPLSVGTPIAQHYLSALVMKLGDFKAWIYVDGQAQKEHNNNTVQSSFNQEGHNIRRLTRSGVIAATLRDSFQVRWVCDTKAPGYALHYSLRFHNMKVATGVVESPNFNKVQTIDGGFEFRQQATTDMDELADIDDDDIATIRLEFQWVRPCSKRTRTRKSCLECSKLRDSQPIKKSRRTSYSTSIPIDPNRIVPGLVHERAKKAHGLSAVSHNYRDLKNDLNVEGGDFQFHGTFKDQNTLRFFYGPKDWLESKGWIEPQVRAPQNNSSPGAERSSSLASEQDSDRSPSPSSNSSQSGVDQWTSKGDPTAIDKGNTHAQAESESTSTASEQVIDIDDDEDEKPSIPPSPPTSAEVKRESSDAGEERSGGNLASMIGLLIREVRQGNALARQTNEGIDRLVRALERNAGPR